MSKTVGAALLALLALAAWIGEGDVRQCRWDARSGDYLCR